MIWIARHCVQLREMDNIQQIEGIMDGVRKKATTPSVEKYLDAISQRTGHSTDMLRKTLIDSEVLDVINQHLSQGATMSDAIAAADRVLMDYVDVKLQEEQIVEIEEEEQGLPEQDSVTSENKEETEDPNKQRGDTDEPKEDKTEY